jgi:hypothetical protein
MPLWMEELWTWQEKIPFWPSTSKCDLDLWARDQLLAHDILAHSGEHLWQVSLKSLNELRRNALDKVILEFDLWPLSVTLALDLGTWFLRMTLRLMVVNICGKLHYNPSMHKEDMLRTKYVDKRSHFELWPPSVTLTLDLGTWFLRMTLRLMVVNTCVKFH